MAWVMAGITLVAAYIILFIAFAVYLRQFRSLKNDLNKYKTYLTELQRKVDKLSCMRELEEDTDDYHQWPKKTPHIISTINVTDYLKEKYFKENE